LKGINDFIIEDLGILTIYDDVDYDIEILGEVGVFWKAGAIMGFGKKKIYKQIKKAIKLILRITDKIEADMKLQNEVDKVPK
jgi:hypothetical protein